MFISGIINLLIINFHVSNNQFDQFKLEKKIDSFYLIGDAYTFFCFTFMFDYIFTQARKISNIFYEENLNYEVINKQISGLVNDTIYDTGISNNDFMWLLVFLLGLFIHYLGMINNRYSLFYISYYYFRETLNIFAKMHSLRVNRIIYNFLFFYLFITNFAVSLQEDPALFQVNIQYTI